MASPAGGLPEKVKLAERRQVKQSCSAPGSDPKQIQNEIDKPTDTWI
jgi:hypothetical protein